MHIKLLQWNIWYREDIKNIAKFLQENPADIICLQELTIGHPEQSVENTPEYIAQELGYNHFYKDLPIEGTDGKKYMIANGIFTKHTIVKSRYVFINEPKAEGGYADEYRAYVEVTLDIDGEQVTVATVHMSYTHHFDSTPGKRQETDRLVAELKKPPGAFIFMGDLNALPGSYTIDAISEVLQNAGPEFSQNTWATKPFTYGGFEASELDWRLDYIFTTSDVLVKSTEILTTDLSDHLPVAAVVKLP